MVEVTKPPRLPPVPAQIKTIWPDFSRWLVQIDDWITTLWRRTGAADDLIEGSVPDTREVIAGAGLTGGGPLSADITISLSVPVSVARGGTGGTTQATARAGIGAEAAGTAAALVTAHEALPDPHPQYTTAGELSAALASYQPVDSDLTAIALLTTTSYGRALLTLADAAALRSTAGLVLGTDIYSKAAIDAGFQPLDSDLTAIAALTTTSFGRALLALADAAALRTSAGLVLGTDIYSKSAADGLFALLATTISAAGLATGGGSLAANRTITVTASSDAQAQAQTSSSVALTPANLAGRAMFSANKAGTNQTGIAATTFTKLTFGTEAFDVGSYFDTTNSRWTPPASKVRISAQIKEASGVTSDGDFLLAIYKNGSELRRAYTSKNGSKAAIASIAIIESANGTDYYEVYVFADSGATFSIEGSGGQTFFEGSQV